jgi:VanZ family protein
MNFKVFIIRYWKSIAVVCCIFYLSFASPSTFERIPTFEHEDKLIHILMYAGLAFTLIFDYRRATKNTTVNAAFLFVCVFFPVLLGGLVEIAQQHFFAPRTASWADWLSDTVGVGLGWAAISFLSQRLIKTK